MPSIAFVAPGPFEARTGGSVYNRRIIDGLRGMGWLVETRELDPGFPHPTPAALDHAGRVLASVPSGTVTIVDSLALGAMPEVITREVPRLTVVALVHSPLAAGIGLDHRTTARFEAGERRALAAAAMVIVTGNAALPLLSRYDIAPSRVVVVEPGTDRAPIAQRYRKGRPDAPAAASDPLHPLELLTVATVNAGKGHEMLLAALSSLPDRTWRLTCAGSLTRDPAAVSRVRTTVACLRLEDRVSFVGELDRDSLEAQFDKADLFVLATEQETYGMAVAEAVAHGLPVVATITGAIPDLVGTDAGLLVSVGDTAGFAEALARVMGDAGLRTRLAEGARRRRDRLPTWDDAFRRMAAALSPLWHVSACG